MTGFLSGDYWGTAGLTLGVIAFIATGGMLVPGLGAARVFGRHNPAARTAILRATLLGLFACPVASIAFGTLGLGGLGVMPRVTRVAGMAVNVVSTAAPTQSQRIADSSRAAGMKHTSEPAGPKPGAISIPAENLSAISANVPTSVIPITASASHSKFSKALAGKIFVGLWIGISILLLARIAIANGVIGIRRRRARPASEGVVNDCKRLAERLGVKAPAVLVGHSMSGPCLVGWWRPAIMLPVEQMSVDRPILAHELAHVSRNDCGWQLIARVAAAVVWFQPLMWILTREMERTAEEACDDIVLELGSDRAGYARQLVELAESTQRGWAAAGAELRVVGLKSSVGRRVARLLSATQLIRTKLRWPVRCGILLATIGLTCGLAAALASRSQTAPPSTSPGMMRFEGRVISVDGKPVANAELNLIQYARFAVQSIGATASRDDGRFVFEIPQQEESATPFDVVLRVRGSALRSYRVKPGEFDELRLEPATQVKVIFLGPDGNPVQGMRVLPESFANPVMGLMTRQDSWYLRLPEALSREFGQTTDASGAVTFNDLPRSMRMRLEVGDERYAAPDVNESVNLASDVESPTTTLRLERGCSISGRVVYGSTGAPAADVHVGIQGSLRGRSASGGMVKTDREGNFHKANMRSGDYNVALYLPPELDKDWTAVARENLRLEPGQNLMGIQLTMIHGAIVRGKVTLADTGGPLFGNDARVGGYGPAHPRSGAAVQSVLIDRDGNYTMRVPPGEQYIYLQGPIPDPYIGREQPHKEITVADGETATVDFVLPRRTGKVVTGIVLDTDGKPVENAAVSVESREIGMYSSPTVQTDAAGKFRLEGVGPGTELRARHGADGTKSPVIVNGGESSVRLVLVRGAEMNATILVTDAAHKPIAHPRLKMTVSNGSYGMGMGEPVTGSADGKITLSHLLSDMRYEIYVEADGYGEDTETLKLNPNNPAPLTVVLTKATTTIKGVVIDSDKQPVAGIPVALDTGNFIHLRTTDGTGHFAFPVVEKQLWKIMVRNDRGTDFSTMARHFDENQIESRFAQGDREAVKFEVPKVAR